jgi:hydroxymethylpyrimidine kinase/phosphomethylpyrimidine kinase/thiamine-phosphate diphosphorylase
LKHFALTIAGSDSSAGAGVQADLRVFQAFDVVGACAVTAVTAQGPTGITAVQLVAPNILKEQIDAAFSSYAIGAVKIGMLGGVDQVRVVAEALVRHHAANVVLDPVLVSSSGTNLIDSDGLRHLIDHLLPIADVVTPNRSELAQLSGMTVSSEEECRAAAQSLNVKSGCTIIVTGGDARARDLIIGNLMPKAIETAFVNTEHTHGTGCALSSGIAAALASGKPLHAALDLAKSYLYWGLQNPIQPEVGRGHPNTYRSAAGADEARWQAVRPKVIEGLYVVTDSELDPSRSHLDLARAAFAGGARIVQLRDKNMPTPELMKIARRIKSLSDGMGLFIVNDRADIALASGAAGVHLGPEDMAPSDARRLLSWPAIVGCSVGTVEEADAAAEYASYLAVGAVFGSTTKDDAGSPVGLGLVREIKDRHPGIPVVAIGGINLSNIASVGAAGADAAAVVSAVVCAADPEQATRELIAEFERGKARRDA